MFYFIYLVLIVLFVKGCKFILLYLSLVGEVKNLGKIYKDGVGFLGVCMIV